MIADNDVTNWIISPAGNCVKYLADETIHASVLHRSIINLTGMRTFIEIAQQKFREEKMDESVFLRLLSENEFLEKEAKKLVESNFHSINSHALIGLWCALETAVEDTIVLILMNDSEAIKILIEHGYKIKPRFTSNMSENDARMLYSSLEKQTRQGLTVSESYCELFAVFGLDIKLDIVTEKTLSEVNAVRNCILHRGGIIDDKASSNSEELRRFVDKKIHITQSLFLRYHEAISDFASKLLGAAAGSKYLRKHI